MDPKFTHIVTESELAAHPEAFAEGTVVGAAVELSPDAYAALGLKLHTLTEEDMANNAEFTQHGLTAGDMVEMPVTAEAEPETAGTEVEATLPEDETKGTDAE